jgi:hypothetical protein
MIWLFVAPVIVNTTTQSVMMPDHFDLTQGAIWRIVTASAGFAVILTGVVIGMSSVLLSTLAVSSPFAQLRGD